jgi:putative ABC transport system ATP-binding protein
VVGGRRIVLADEPTSNVDQATRGVIVGLFQALLSQGVTVVVVSHDRVIEVIAADLYTMSHGLLRRR